MAKEDISPVKKEKAPLYDTRFSPAHLWLILIITIITARLTFGSVNIRQPHSLCNFAFGIWIRNIFSFNNSNKEAFFQAIKQELNKFANISLKTVNFADDFDQLDVDHT